LQEPRRLFPASQATDNEALDAARRVPGREALGIKLIERLS
jgi:hypothetical protein